ncbi:energy transducer TonB [Dyadobacter sp. MSC1_007]|jgi:TonB family protein|uniref:energy transducer TonB n=1 Tax=Dyadobacter sp. MSC1_007 TaxID=2909264 RepID=UPI00202F8F94|nr:energy transducer TonB [Dyadobacter sp. MSC1_007]
MKHIAVFYYVTAAGLTITACSSPKAKTHINTAASLPVDTGHVEVLAAQQPFFDNMPNALQDNKETRNEKVFGLVELQPQFPGGPKELYAFIGANLKMPREAKKAGISGRVFLSFTVEATGEIKNVAVLKGLGFGCDEEAIRLVESMPKWKPGTLYDKPTRVKYNLPINFISEE